MKNEQPQWELVMSSDDNPDGERIEGPFNTYEDAFVAYKFWVGHYLEEITSFLLNGFNYRVNGKERSIVLLVI